MSRVRRPPHLCANTILNSQPSLHYVSCRDPVQCVCGGGWGVVGDRGGGEGAGRQKRDSCCVCGDHEPAYKYYIKFATLIALRIVA